MFEKILKKEVQDFINANLNADVNKLALSKNPFNDLDWSFVLNQIASKQKAKTKLPTWFATQNIIYPTKLNIEQTSSESTASYKANLILGESLIDLTGGFGIDDFYFAKKFKKVVHCELNTELSEKVDHNKTVLNQLNIQCIAGDSTEILQRLNQNFDWIYVDPSRRNDGKGKVFQLKDCLPNVPELLDLYFKYSHQILIKNSPILDITQAISELNFVKKVYIIALENEVKEFLIEIEKDFVGEIRCEAVNLTKNNIQKFEHTLADDATTKFTEPKTYLYEPNSAIMKSGLFNAIANTFNLSKLHIHSHLYTSEELISDFPGRIFKIENSFEFNKQNASSFLKNQKMNLTTRNFLISVEDLRKKYKINDGGTDYAFATTTLQDKKMILICQKI